MGIRLKVLLAFVLCFGVMAGIGLYFLQRSVDQSYGAIERAEVGDNMGRVEQSFAASAVSLKNQTKDWATWNEMYRYALNPDPNWVVENIGDDALAPADISMVMIFDLDGRLLNISTEKTDGRNLKVLTPQIAPYLDRIRSNLREAQCGIMRIDAGLMLACWSGIFPSDGSGDPVGTVLMGRLFDPVRLEMMREQTKLPFELSVQPQMPGGLQLWPEPLAAGLLGSGDFWAASNAETYHLFYPVRDILGQNVGLISLDMPRRVNLQGLMLSQQVRRQLGWTALFVTVLLGLALDFILIRRLRRFARQIDMLEERSTWKVHIDIGGRDELGLVAKNFNALLDLVDSQVEGLRESVEAKENAIELMRVTQAQLIASEKLAQRRQGRVSNLLDNSGQGFLSFGGDRVIDPEVSRACRTMLGCSPAGQDAAQVLFGDDPVKADLFCEIILAVRGETDPDVRDSMLSLLPAEIQRCEILLNAEYKALEGDRFMVVLTDITEERRLQAMLRDERCRLELIVAAVTDTRNFFASVETFREFLACTLPDRLRTDLPPDVLARTLYREIHTYKGLLGQFGFVRTPARLHDIEARLVGSQRPTRESITEIVSPSALLTCFNDDLAVLTEALGPEFLQNGERFIVSGAQAEQLEKMALRLLQGKPVDTASPELRRLLNEIVRLRNMVLRDVLTDFDAVLRQAAHRVEKIVAPIEVIGGDDIWVDPRQYKAFLHALGHVFRNAMVHGIEMPDERRALGKDDAGHVVCRVSLEKGRIRLSIADDGAGIDLVAIRQRAVAAGLCTHDEASAMSDDEAVRLIFRDKLSVRDTVTELSGRGVGLAAVLAETHLLGGEIKVATWRGKGTEFQFDLPLQQCAVSEVMFSGSRRQRPILLSTDAALVMQSIVGKTRAYFEGEHRIGVSSGHTEGGELESLRLLAMTALIGLGGRVDLRVAFSFEESLVDAIYERMTAGFNDRPEDVGKHRAAALGEVLNTVLGHCTVDLQHLDRQGIAMTPPRILAPGQAIAGENGAVFYTQELNTARGRLAVSLVGSREIFVTTD